MAEPLKMDIEAIMRAVCRIGIRSCWWTGCSTASRASSIHALKNVTFNEPFFPGHFPHRPVMPGVMIIEALAQAAGHPRVHNRRCGAGLRYALLFRRHRQRAVSQAGRARAIS